MYGIPFIALPSGALVPGQTLPSGLIIPSPTISNPTITGVETVTNATLLQQQKTVGQWAYPFIFPPTGTMADNGAFTSGTALPATYSGGAWCYFDTDDIAAGVAAGWYWTVWSSTTAATVYNSLYTTGNPGAGTATAFVTTGPGATVGVTTEVFGPEIAIAAGAMLLNGRLEYDIATRQTNNANVKTLRMSFTGSGGSDWVAANLASRAEGRAWGYIQNRGIAASQFGASLAFGSSVANSAVFLDATVNTALASSMIFSFQRATATDAAVIEAGSVVITLLLT